MRRLLRKFLYILTPLLPVSCAAAQDFLRLGDSAYHRHAYDSAITYYERASAGGSAEALYKWGNALYQRGRKGEAVLAWCTALRRRPGFAAAASNIATVQQGLKYGGGTGAEDAALIRWWQTITGPGASNAWAILALGLFAVYSGSLALRRFKRNAAGGLRPPVRNGILAVSLLCAIIAIYAAYRSVPRNAAVVMHADSRCLLSGKGGTVVNLPEGLLVRVEDVQRDTTRVLLYDGRSGFVQSVDIALVK